MPVIGCGDGDGIDVFSGDEFTVVVVGFGVFVAVFFVDHVEAGGAVGFIDIADGDDLNVFEGHHDVHVVSSHSTGSDGSHNDAV